jgi:hypothetical protein
MVKFLKEMIPALPMRLKKMTNQRLSGRLKAENPQLLIA